MTLILVAANVGGVHQSSDYQLVNEKTGAPVTDQAGSKQLQATFKELDLRLAFTGVAALPGPGGSKRTIDCLLSELKALAPDSTLEHICERLQQRSSELTRGLGERGVLELVVSVGAREKPFRLAVISNVDWSKRPPRARARFTTKIRTVSGPLYVISGYRGCVPAVQRRRLRAASRDTKQSVAMVLNMLAEINAIAAKNSGGWVSENCWVTSQTSDGGSLRSSSRNVGQQPGTVPHVFGGMDISEWIKENFRAAPGKQITFVQGAGVKTGPTGGTPMPPASAKARTFKLSGSSLSVPLLSATGERCAFVDVTQLEAEFELRLNTEIEVPFARLALRAVHPIAPPFPKPLYPWPEISPRLSIDGIEVPRGWRYSVGYWIEGNTHRAIFPPSSRGIRNLAFLDPHDEMVIVAPSNELEFAWTDGKNGSGAIVNARIGWRSRLDGTVG